MERDSNYDETNRLQELGGSDFEIAENQPNIKGWTVKNPQGETIGEVDELIFDVQSRKVRYMVVDLEGNVLDLEPRDVLVPIGLAELDESEDDVILPNVTADQLRALPVYHSGRIDRDMETSIRSVFGGMGAAAGAAVAGAATDASTTGYREDFYDHNHFNESNLNRNRMPRTDSGYGAPVPNPNLTEGDTSIPIIEENLHVGKQEVETGGARISSRIVEEEAEENITLREEHINVERTPVNRPATDADINAFKEGETELTEHAEVPVVNKEARVVEEINLRKDVEEHEEVIRDTVRKTEVDVDKINPDADNLRTDTDRYPEGNDYPEGDGYPEDDDQKRPPRP